MSSSDSVDNNKITVIIDPGHGGADGGAVTENGIEEKIINLRISEYIRDFCLLSGVDCILTRNNDSMLIPKYSGSAHKKRADLIARTEIASMYDNGIFISIHQNKFENSRYSGLQVFYSKNNRMSAVLAETIKNTNRELISPGNLREIKPVGNEIFVLDNIFIPAVLVECGFLSNSVEASKLNSDKYQRELAFMIYTSIMKYVFSYKT